MKLIRYGMIGGGQGAFIGGAHRTAAAIAGNWQLVAGAFSSTPEKSKASGAEIGVPAERVKAFHVKDAEFRPSGRAGVYGSYSSWVDRPGRFRSLGDGQIDFGAIFSKLTQYGYDGWAVLEWECALKHPEQGAAEGAPFIARHMIRKADKAFDDFAGVAVDKALLNQVLGLF